MPRNLPWVTEAAAKKQQARDARNQQTPVKGHDVTPGDLVDADLNTTGVVTPERRKVLRPARSPSTSPAPAPPDVEFMREGFDADDVWMMVEDEFWATAQKFTQHIHRAEYDRLRKLARSRGDRTLRALERPTDGKTERSVGMQIRLEAEEKGKKIQSDVRKVVGEESEDEDAYMLDTNLAGLMTGSQATGHDLTSIVKAKSNTRAAAGFHRSSQEPRILQSQGQDCRDKQNSRRVGSRTPRVASTHVLHEENETESDSDDLDAVGERNENPGRKLSTMHNQANQRRTSSNDQDVGNIDSESTSLFKRFAKHATESDSHAGGRSSTPNWKTRTPKRPISNILPSSSDEDNGMSNEKSYATEKSYTKRQLQRTRANHEVREQNPKPRSDAISVPMWL